MTIRNHVTFRHPAEFVESDDFEGILSTEGAGWFVELLASVPRLAVDPKLCQEDWGVAIFADRDAYSFWVGLSPWDEGAWLAHVHHGGFIQGLRRAGKDTYARLVADLGIVLANADAVTRPEWYFEGDGDGGIDGVS